jgi:hypothetical protein
MTIITGIIKSGEFVGHTIKLVSPDGSPQNTSVYLDDRLNNSIMAVTMSISVGEPARVTIQFNDRASIEADFVAEFMVNTLSWRERYEG